MEKALKSDSLWCKCLLSHVCSLWYVLLPCLLSTHWNKMGILSQAMELLEDMRINKALPSDEVTKPQLTLALETRHFVHCEVQ